MKKISILLIEDNRLLREGICALLKKQLDMNVVDTVGNGENILLLLEKLSPHIVLLDLGLRSQNSLFLVKMIKKKFSDIKIIVMDLIPIQEDVLEFVQAGVSGFILKDANIEDFYSTIRAVMKGEQILPHDLTASLFSQIIEQYMHATTPSIIIESVKMTKREKQIIDLISQGDTNKEIAQKIHISPYTVKSHVHNILEKLSIQTRVQIANYAHITKSYKESLGSPSLIEE